MRLRCARLLAAVVVATAWDGRLQQARGLLGPAVRIRRRSDAPPRRIRHADRQRVDPGAGRVARSGDSIRVRPRASRSATTRAAYQSPYTQVDARQSDVDAEGAAIRRRASQGHGHPRNCRSGAVCLVAVRPRAARRPDRISRSTSAQPARDAGPLRTSGRTGDEIVAFRLHLPQPDQIPELPVRSRRTSRARRRARQHPRRGSSTWPIASTASRSPTRRAGRSRRHGRPDGPPVDPVPHALAVRARVPRGAPAVRRSASG